MHSEATCSNVAAMATIVKWASWTDSRTRRYLAGLQCLLRSTIRYAISQCVLHYQSLAETSWRQFLHARRALFKLSPCYEIGNFGINFP